MGGPPRWDHCVDKGSDGAGRQNGEMRPWWVLLAVLVGGCSGGGGGDTPEDPMVGARAVRQLELIVAGDFALVAEDFDDTVAAQLDADGLRTAWEQYTNLFGQFVGHAPPTVEERGAMTVVRIELDMAGEDREFRVSYDDLDRIAGIFFLRQGVPLP